MTLFVNAIDACGKDGKENVPPIYTRGGMIAASILDLDNRIG